jgi:hypothetical protein
LIGQQDRTGCTKQRGRGRFISGKSENPFIWLFPEKTGI